MTHELARTRDDDVLVSTMNDIPGHRVVEVFGLARGNTIRARHVGHDITAVFKAIMGGEITEYTKMMAESREQALDRLRGEAAGRGANAVLGLRFTTSMIMAGASEILAYGTAVRVEPIDE
jgi:uncharacterized protein YbjQ (UPF0145 family)